MKFVDKGDDVMNSSDRLELHQDEPYYEESPGIVFLHCIRLVRFMCIPSMRMKATKIASHSVLCSPTYNGYCISLIRSHSY